MAKSLRADIDLRPALPGAERLRGRRLWEIDAIVVHRIGGTKRLATLDDVVQFFTADPTGIASVAATGGWQRHKRLGAAWERSGIPQWAKNRAHVPYHAIIVGGSVVATTPIARVTSHAAGWNRRSIGIAVFGDFRDKYDVGGEGQHTPSEKTLRALEAALQNAVEVVPTIERIVAHDETRDAPKGCPGARLLAQLPDIAGRVLASRPHPGMGTD